MSILFISDNNTPIIQFYKTSIYIEYFLNSYVICTSPYNDIYNKSRKRRYREIIEKELMSLLDIKIHDDIDLYIRSCFFLEPEVNFENSFKINKKNKFLLIIK